jgi:hypothetical protein
MNKLALLILLTGAAQAEEINLEFSAQGSVQFDFSQQALLLNERQPQSAVLPTFVGPCEKDACDVTVNTPFSIFYTVAGANQCYGTGGPLTWQVNHPHTNGFHVIEVEALQADTALTLNCVQASDLSTHSLTVLIKVVAGGGNNCTAAVFPPNLTRITGVYSQYNDGVDFGESTNTSFELDIPNTHFFALSGFSLTGNSQLNVRRKIILADAPTQRQIDQSTMSVSECPGDFSNTATCVIPISTTLPHSRVNFSTVPSDDPAVFCILDPTKTYYVNFVNSPDPYNTPPSCRIGHSACTVFYSEGLVAPP